MGRISKGNKARKEALKKGRAKLAEKKQQTTQELQADVVAIPSTSSAVSPPPSPPPPSPAPSSAEKRKKLLKKLLITEEECNDNSVFSIKETFTELAKSMFCSKCDEKKVHVQFIPNQLDISVKFICEKCKYVVFNNVMRSKCKNNTNFRVNTMRLVYLMMMLGHSYAAVKKFCAFFDLPKLTSKSYFRYAKEVRRVSVEKTKRILEESRKAVVEFYGKNLGRVPDEEGVLDVDLTFDGSWATRGFKSNFGFTCVIDAHSGLVLDYQIYSKKCSMCDIKEAELSKKKIIQEEFDRWKQGHAPSCDCNYSGTSGGMEKTGAVDLWGRSVGYKFRYVNLIGDGDSAAHLAVTSMNGGNGPYGEITVQKEECVNHYSKRLGTALRNLVKGSAIYVDTEGKKKRKVTLGGKNRLTDAVIDRLQYYFGISVRRKSNTSISEMRNDILSSFYHCSSTDSTPRHHLCPKGEESWCFYQKAEAKGTPPKSHKEMLVHFMLGPEELKLVENVYKRLTSDENMIKCLRGKTQNPNENLHQRIWLYCPKHLTPSRMRLDFAASQAVAQYNAGYEASRETVYMTYDDDEDEDDAEDPLAVDVEPFMESGAEKEDPLAGPSTFSRPSEHVVKVETPDEEEKYNSNIMTLQFPETAPYNQSLHLSSLLRNNHHHSFDEEVSIKTEEVKIEVKEESIDDE